MKFIPEGTTVRDLSEVAAMHVRSIIADGKRLAEENWLQRITPALEQVGSGRLTARGEQVAEGERGRR